MPGRSDWEQYFFAQVFAQYFILAALWYTTSYVQNSNWIFAALIGAALLGVVAAYPIFVALPLALFGLVVIARIFVPVFVKARQSIDDAPESLTRPPAQSHSRRALLTLGIFIALMVLAAIALQRGGILELITAEKAARGDVGAGGVTNAFARRNGRTDFSRARARRRVVRVETRRGGQNDPGSPARVDLPTDRAVGDSTLFPGLRLSRRQNILPSRLSACDACHTAARARRWIASPRACNCPPRALVAGFVAAVIVLSAAVGVFRPPKVYSPLTESELQVAFWAKGFFNNTYQISYLDQEPISAYWLSIGIWGERHSERVVPMDSRQDANWVLRRSTSGISTQRGKTGFWCATLKKYR